MQKNFIIEKCVFFIKYKWKLIATNIGHNINAIFDLPYWQFSQTSQHIFKQTWSNILENKIDSNRGSFIKSQMNSTSSDQKWQPVTTSATSDNEWQRVVQRITTSDNEWQQVTKNGKEWQQVKTKTTSGTTNAKKWHDKWTWMKANKSDFRFQNKRIMEYITTIYSATSFSKHYVKENICRSSHRRCFTK